MDISNNAKKARPSSTLSISSNANRMIDEGIDIVNFSAGEPDFNTPDYIKEAAIEAINDTLKAINAKLADYYNFDELISRRKKEYEEACCKAWDIAQKLSSIRLRNRL